MFVGKGFALNANRLSCAGYYGGGKEKKALKGEQVLTATVKIIYQSVLVWNGDIMVRE